MDKMSKSTPRSSNKMQLFQSAFGGLGILIYLKRDVPF